MFIQFNNTTTQELAGLFDSATRSSTYTPVVSYEYSSYGPKFAIETALIQGYVLPENGTLTMYLFLVTGQMFTLTYGSEETKLGDTLVLRKIKPARNIRELQVDEIGRIIDEEPISAVFNNSIKLRRKLSLEPPERAKKETSSE